MLGARAIKLSLNNETITLRPSLRAALVLVREYESPMNLVEQIMQGSLTAFCDVLEAGSNSKPEFCTYVDATVLSKVLVKVQPILTSFVLSLAIPADKEAKEQPDNTDDLPTWVESYERLFGIATGNLGWSPQEAWEATPAEIAIAYKARVELLQSIFGGGEEKINTSKKLSLDQQARIALDGFKTRKVTRNAA